MGLGGGTFLVQNKVLPGAYINFVSAARASANLSDRGYVALALELDWGVDGDVFTVENADFQTDSLKIFGYDYTSPKLKGLRDLFLNAKTLYAYRLNSGVKAKNTYATAKYSGIRGNDLRIIVSANVDEPTKFDVTTMLDMVIVDNQTVSTSSGLADNDFAVFKKTATLEVTTGMSLTGGTNGTVVGTAYQTFLDKVEAYSFNTLGCLSTEETVKSLFVAFTKRLRDEMGVKFQTVLYNKTADHEGIINLKNAALDAGANGADLVYWLTGASAGCAVNKSNQNKLYDGEFEIYTDYKQSQLAAAIKAGEFVFHKVGEEIRVLDDINSFTSVTVDKNDDFQSNQVVRVLDQIGNDIAVLFNTRYLGKVQNNDAGRIAFWNDLVSYNKQMEQIQAIENFVSDDLKVEKGNDKKSVTVTNPVTPVAAMAKLYMTVIVQ
ncbi:phage tail sheath family protein [Anaerotignum propionicum]|uniref:phage tail sheath family protein n=1 Tax=Anaerotignum propionicum TaxID=28446 RepID=UPI00210C5348|nr:phage tail sheath family protein [Anaerotignum propionicum]MCQ4935031.1 phage tail sheath family protein [Anaerotignum propionicum]